jgi:hypothetical protein
MNPVLGRRWLGTVLAKADFASQRIKGARGGTVGDAGSNCMADLLSYAKIPGLRLAFFPALSLKGWPSGIHERGKLMS